MPGCMQQFINHNGVLHKVYVMGDQVRAVMHCLLHRVLPSQLLSAPPLTIKAR